MTEPADVAIVGGGLVGLCAALALQHPDRRIEVIEAAGMAAPEPGGLNARSIALSYTSRQLFRALGIWTELEARAAMIRTIHVSAHGRWGVTRLQAADYGLDALGYVIENRVLTEVLQAAVAASETIRVHDQARFESLEQNDLVSIDYQRNHKAERLEARIALIADGARSQARAALGIAHRVIDYAQTALIFNVEVSHPQAGWAYERFTHQGPLAMLPLGDRRYACVWTLGADQAAEIENGDEDRLIDQLQKRFGFRLGRIERAGRPFSFPIQRVQADRLHCGRCVLIGNSANALHPVAGQSFNLSLRDVASLYEDLVGHSIGALSSDEVDRLMASYASARQAEQRQVIRYGEGLVSIFSNQLPILDPLRAASLAALDVIPTLKAEAAFAGMGLRFGGNRLLRGHW